MAQKKNQEKKERRTEVSDSPLVGPVIAGLVMGTPLDVLKKQVAQRTKLTDKEWEALVDTARQKINHAASFDAREEYGKTRLALEQIYKKAMEYGDLKTALATRKEQTKIYGLYDAASLRAVEESYRSATEEMVRGHLEPLGIATKAGLPIEELARQVALYFVSHFSGPWTATRKRRSGGK